jgi:hypothetical protein
MGSGNGMAIFATYFILASSQLAVYTWKPMDSVELSYISMRKAGVRWLAFVLVFTLPACSEALDNESDKCIFSDEMVVSKVERGGKVVQYDAKRMPAKQGRERTLSEHIRLANNDDISIVQSYCYVYRYDLKYRLSGEKKPTSLVEILPVLDDLISKSYAADYLTQPFSEIVLDSLTMQQKMLKMPFTQGLPARYTSSSEFVGYFIDYKPLEKNKKYSAEFRVHIDVGGAD